MREVGGGKGGWVVFALLPPRTERTANALDRRNDPNGVRAVGGCPLSPGSVSVHLPTPFWTANEPMQVNETQVVYDIIDFGAAEEYPAM